MVLGTYTAYTQGLQIIHTYPPEPPGLQDYKDCRARSSGLRDHRLEFYGGFLLLMEIEIAIILHSPF